MRTFGRVLLVVLLLGAIGAMGYGVWNAGYQQGLTETVETTADVVVTTPFYPGFFAFGFFGVLLRVLFVVLIVALIARLIWGRRRGWGPSGVSPGDHYRSSMEERLNRWHDEAHGRRAPPDVDIA